MMNRRFASHWWLDNSADWKRAPFPYDLRHVGDSRGHFSVELADQFVSPFPHNGTVLVPLDGSRAAEHALPHALTLARRSAGTVQLVHVHSWKESAGIWQQYRSDKSTERLRRKKQAYLQSVVRRISGLVDVPTAALVIESEDIEKSLCEAAAGAALVVMATHGRGPLGRLLHGSVADTLMRELPCPLLVVRGYDSQVRLNADVTLRRVLVPLDGTAFAEEILDPAAAVHWPKGTQFMLAHIQNATSVRGRFARAHAGGYLLEVARRIKGRLPEVRTRVVSSDQRVATTIRLLAEEQEVDLIALTTHGRRGLARLLKGSVADSLVRKANTPVLVYRPPNRVAGTVEVTAATSLGS